MKNRRKKVVQAPDLGRRRVLGSAMGLGTAAGLGLLSVSGHASTERTAVKAARPRNYHETDHIRRYYKSTRL
ncbi:MAG: hypothetical protein KGY49_05000 [Wenzhouxiangellaceae bacterium]|jgi:hypothetical protein|nr:hypothetical protein [Wenzhouxiangellaceae bacterium]